MKTAMLGVSKQPKVIWSKDKINPIQAAQNSELSTEGFSLDYDLDLNVKITDWLTFATTNRLSAYTEMDKTYYSKSADNIVYYGLGLRQLTKQF